MVEDLRLAWPGIPADAAAVTSAAALDPQQVRADLAAGRLDPASLRRLAESRGYRLPPAA
jgi:hypothetical protein